MAYRKIDPRLWDDEKFIDLLAVEKLLWLYILTGPHTTSLPGLWIVGMGEFVDGLRLEAKYLEKGFARLERMGRLIRNPRVRVIRVPNAPRYNRPDNARVLKSWFKLWSDIPECQQKYDHLESLRVSVFAPGADEASEDQPPQGQALIAQWKSTFGVVVVPKQYQPRGRPATARKPDLLANEAGQASGQVRDDAPKSSRTVRPSDPNSSPVPDLATVLDPVSSLDPSETPPETARAHAHEPTASTMSPEAAEILARLSGHEVLRSTAVRSTAEALAAIVVQGRATMAAAMRGIDAVADNYAVSREFEPKPPAELAKWIANRIKATANERSNAPPEVQRAGWTREDSERRTPVLGSDDGSV